MRGVDVMDKIILSYSFDHHSHKWWKSCFIALLEIAMHNAYILYQIKTKVIKTSRLLFRMSIINTLTKGKIIDNLSLHKTQNKESNLIECNLGISTRGDSSICSNYKNRHQSRYGCTTCNVNL